MPPVAPRMHSIMNQNDNPYENPIENQNEHGMNPHRVNSKKNKRAPPKKSKRPRKVNIKNSKRVLRKIKFPTKKKKILHEEWV